MIDDGGLENASEETLEYAVRHDEAAYQAGYQLMLCKRTINRLLVAGEIEAARNNQPIGTPVRKPTTVVEMMGIAQRNQQVQAGRGLEYTPSRRTHGFQVW